MLRLNSMAKEAARGVFWAVNGELFAYPFYGDTVGVASSGLTYNRKRLWQAIKPDKHPYNYYPRGRVDFTNKGKPVVYMNPNIDDSYISLIKSEFGLRQEPVVRYDYSNHYKCYLDEGWESG